MRPFRASILRRPPGILRRRVEPPPTEQPLPPDGASPATTTAQDPTRLPATTHGAASSAGTTEGRPGLDEGAGTSMGPPAINQPPVATMGRPRILEDQSRNRVRCIVGGCNSAGGTQIFCNESSDLWLRGSRFLTANDGVRHHKLPLKDNRGNPDPRRPLWLKACRLPLDYVEPNKRAYICGKHFRVKTWALLVVGGDGVHACMK